MSQIKPAILACPRASLISLCLTSQLYHIKLVTWFPIKEITSACPGRILEKPTMLNAILSPCIHLGIYRFFFHCYFNMTLYKALHNLPLALLPFWSLPHPTRWLHSCQYTGLFVVPWTPEVCPRQVFHTLSSAPGALLFSSRYMWGSMAHIRVFAQGLPSHESEPSPDHLRNVKSHSLSHRGVIHPLTLIYFFFIALITFQHTMSFTSLCSFSISPATM